MEERDLQRVLITQSKVGMFGCQVFLQQVGIEQTVGRSPRVHFSVASFNEGCFQNFPTVNRRDEGVNFVRLRASFSILYVAGRDGQDLICFTVRVCRVLVIK